jgi:hypothetical protein
MIASPCGWAVLASLAIALPAWAQQRPSEEELFGPAPDGGTPAPRRTGGPSPERATETPASALEEEPPKGQERSRDERALSSPPTSDLFASEPNRDNPLTIGGQIYLRSIVQASEGQALGKDRFFLPALVDGYFDARPSDRVRGMVLGRLIYDPTLDANGNANIANNPAFGSGSNTTGSGFFNLPSSSNPAVFLDQLWVNFDIARTVFITAGKQHVKWGVSRFWNPTDFLTPQRRDPLAVFDPRLGASMVKVHLPSESHGWNLYAIGLIDNAGPASTLGQLGGAIRGEIAFARSEIGAEAVFVPGRKDRFGLDASSAIGPLDAYLETSLSKGSDVPLFRINPNANPASGLAGQFEQFTPTNYKVAASGGFNTTIVIAENNNLVLGVEYFYNSIGYDSERFYPFLIFRDFTRPPGTPPSFQPFYLGRHYGAVYATFTSPSILGENSSFILSNLSNLSDRSVITRLDFLTRVLSYLFLEAYADVHYGRHGGEFRLQINLPPQPPTTTQAITIPAPLFDAGLGVRIKI